MGKKLRIQIYKTKFFR